MIRQLRILTGLELRRLFNINRVIHSKDKKEKSTYGGGLAAYIFVYVMMAFYIAMITGALCSLNMGDVALNMIVGISSAMVVLFGVLKAGGVIFAKSGHDQLCSLPLCTESVVLSRFISMYLEDLVTSLLIMAPGCIVYGVLLKPSPLFYIYAFAATLFIPMLPLVICTVVGTLISGISAKIKRKSIFRTVFTLALALGMMSISMSMGSAEEDSDAMANMMSGVGDKFTKLYPPAAWLAKALHEESILGLLGFIALSVAALALTVWVVAKLYHPICNRLFASNAKHDYKLTALKSTSVLKSMYKREFKRYFASSVYVTNTIIGPILGLVAAVALPFVWHEIAATPMPVDLAKALPYVFGLVLTLAPTTAAAISMEGKEAWIAKSLPISAKPFVDSKLAVNLTLTLPAWLAATVSSVIVLKTDLLGILWLSLILLSLIIFSTVAGLALDRKFGSLEFDNEAQVVKQSMPVGLWVFVAMIGNALLAAGGMLLPYPNVYNFCIVSLLLLTSGLMYSRLIKMKLSELK